MFYRRKDLRLPSFHWGSMHTSIDIRAVPYLRLQWKKCTNPFDSWPSHFSNHLAEKSARKYRNLTNLMSRAVYMDCSILENTGKSSKIWSPCLKLKCNYELETEENIERCIMLYGTYLQADVMGAQGHRRVPWRCMDMTNDEALPWCTDLQGNNDAYHPYFRH